jgi:large subunit ribosomal protein L10
MKNTKEKKKNIITEINNLLLNSVSTTILEYSKVTSLELKHIRKALFNKNIKAKVLKNNLIKKALTETENGKLLPYVHGQILIIFSNSELSEPLKIIKDLIQKITILKLKRRIYMGEYLNKDITKIIRLNSKEQELQNLIYSLKTSVIRLAQILNNLIKLKTMKLEKKMKLTNEEIINAISHMNILN